MAESLPPDSATSPGLKPSKSHGPRIFHSFFLWVLMGLLLGCLLCVAALPFLQTFLLDREKTMRVTLLQQENELQSAQNEALRNEISKLQDVLAGDPCEQLVGR